MLNQLNKNKSIKPGMKYLTLILHEYFRDEVCASIIWFGFEPCDLAKL